MEVEGLAKVIKCYENYTKQQVYIFNLKINLNEESNELQDIDFTNFGTIETFMKLRKLNF